jgi:hypothetical protein
VQPPDLYLLQRALQHPGPARWQPSARHGMANQSVPCIEAHAFVNETSETRAQPSTSHSARYADGPTRKARSELKKRVWSLTSTLRSPSRPVGSPRVRAVVDSPAHCGRPQEWAPRAEQ